MTSNLKEAGQQLALLGAGPEWLDATMQRFQTFCKARIEAGQPTFRIEEFRNEVERSGNHAANNKVWGAIPREARKQGLIESTGNYQPATSKKTHGHPVRVWQAI